MDLYALPARTGRRDTLHDGSCEFIRGLVTVARQPFAVVRHSSMYLTLFGGLFVGLGLAMAWYGARPLVVLPRLLRTEVRRPDAVTDAGDGEFVAVLGTARASAETLRSPFTGTECLGFEFEVTERQPFGIGVPWFHAHLDDGIATAPFSLDDPNHPSVPDDPGVLDDAAGGLAVRPSSRRFSLDTVPTVVRVGARETPPDRVRRFVDVREGLDPVAGRIAAIPFLGARRYVERRIDPGEEYLVAGRIERDGRGENGTTGIALSGDLVITERSIRGFVLSRLRRAAFPLLVAAVFVVAGLWGIVG
ncbi:MULTISPECIES: hypothetical protein [Haloferacaceae]|uniref:RING-type E3 ubiquitin transferase n=1 Tax=Halorubrum glutamatedens TaxID=2707018 RepID=A0ABD5QRJ8_9EURY|nr:hypothetical protein [Halobellus captivus]